MTGKEIELDETYYAAAGEPTPAIVPVSFFKHITNLRPHIQGKNGIIEGNIHDPEIQIQIQNIGEEAHIKQLSEEVEKGDKVWHVTAVLGGIVFVTGLAAAAEFILRDGQDINNVTHHFYKKQS